jgi:DNA-binding beta-propeller fold protein YncE
VVATDSLRVSHVIPTFGFDHGELKISPDGVFVYFDEKLVWDSGPEIGQMAEFRTSDYGFYGACACGIDMNADPTGPIGYSLACSPSGDIVVAVDSGEDEGEVYTDVCCFQVPNPGGYNSAGWVEGAMDLQFDRWNPHLYVLCWNDTLRDLDAVSMDNLRSLNLGNRTSHGMIRLSNDSRYAYITQREPPGVTVVDLTNWHVVTTLRLSAQEGTWAEALSPDGNFLYVGEGNSSIIHIADVSDPPNASWLNQVKVGNGQVRGICFAPDGSRAYVSVCPDGVAVLGLK